MARPDSSRFKRIGFAAVIVVLGIVVAVVLALGADRPGNSPRMELAAHVPYEMGGDLQFQRRSGSHTVDGATVQATTDLVFASAHADRSRIDGEIEIIDVTNPNAPKQLTRIPCPGYQSDVAIHEALLVQTIDFAQSNGGCDPEWLRATGSTDIDRAGVGGVRIFDVADPAQPRLIQFVEVVGQLGEGVHDVTVVPWAGVAYLAQLDGHLGIVDLNDPSFPYAAISVASISPDMTTSCHDIGLDPVRLLAFCAANEDKTYILDVRVPTHPAYVAKVVNAALSRHHGALMAPDGTTLVLQSEFDHPPAVGSDAAAGLWFYDLSVPTDPVVLGSWAPTSCAPSEQAERACTSHWYNFIPGTNLLVASWRHEGVFVVDYGNPSAPIETASYRPSRDALSVLSASDPTDFWSAYFWHGYVYGSANRTGGGLYILRPAGVGDAEPSPYDEGTSWGRWTPGSGASATRR